MAINVIFSPSNNVENSYMFLFIKNSTQILRPYYMSLLGRYKTKLWTLIHARRRFRICIFQIMCMSKAIKSSDPGLQRVRN